MNHCAKCDWLGIMDPCPHEGEPFPIYRRAVLRTRLAPLDVTKYIELGAPDDMVVDGYEEDEIEDPSGDE